LNFVFCPVHYFFGNAGPGSITDLSPEEARHAFVLRLKPGEKVGLLDGKGAVCLGEVIFSGPKGAQVLVREVRNQPAPKPHIHLAIAPVKQSERMEWLVEKITEIGVSEISPLICDHSERFHFRPDRLEKIAHAALKQSGRPWQVLLHPPVRFEDFMSQDFRGARLIGNQQGRPLKGLFGEARPDEITLCIGPEGDFSEKELSLADKNGFIKISFGDVRLRTETAALVISGILAGG
jgi:16S rRNA (uracil1498-N3)-methyltransferase